MKELQPSPVPERTLLGSFYRAGTAGIGTPVCEQCAQPRYSYVARAKGLAGVVILEIGVTSQGTIEDGNVDPGTRPGFGNCRHSDHSNLAVQTSN